MTAFEIASTCETSASPGGRRRGSLVALLQTTICNRLTTYGTARCIDHALPVAPTRTVKGTWCPPVAIAMVDNCPREFPDCAEAIPSHLFHCEFTTVNGFTIDQGSFTVGGLTPSLGKGLEASNGNLAEAWSSLEEASGRLDQSSVCDRSDDLEPITALAESLAASASTILTLTCLHRAEQTSALQILYQWSSGLVPTVHTCHS